MVIRNSSLACSDKPQIIAALCGVLLLLCGCAEAPTPLSPRTAGRHVVIYSLGPGTEAQVLRSEADRTAEDVARVLVLTPSSAMADLRLFDTRGAMRAYLKQACPGQADSGAACFATPDGMVIALYRQSTLPETLRLMRHEVVQFVVDVRFQQVPAWAHEGLAQYFENGTPYDQPNAAALKLLAGDIEGGTHGGLRKLIEAPAGAELSRKQSARAWALTHFLLTGHANGAAEMARYLASVRSDQPAVEQFVRAFGATPEDMESQWRAHLKRLEQSQLPGGEKAQ